MIYIEKNMCENVVQTIFGQNYTIKVQCDMQVESIQQHLWLRLHSHNQHKILKPHVFRVLIVDELNILLSRMASMKLFIDY